MIASIKRYVVSSSPHKCVLSHVQSTVCKALYQHEQEPDAPRVGVKQRAQIVNKSKRQIIQSNEAQSACAACCLAMSCAMLINCVFGVAFSVPLRNHMLNIMLHVGHRVDHAHSFEAVHVKAA